MPEPRAEPEATAEPEAMAEPAAAAGETSAVPGDDAAPIEPAGAAASVLIRVTPAGAFIVHDGRKIGQGQVRLTVKRGQRKVVVARYPGYAPRRLAVDGSEAEVSVSLEPTKEPEGRSTPRQSRAVSVPTKVDPNPY